MFSACPLIYTIRMITKSCVSDFFFQPVLTQPTRVECPLRRRCLVNNFHPNPIHSTHAPITSTSTSNCLMGVGGGVMVTMVPWPGPEPPPTSTPQPSMPLQGCQGLESRLTTSYSEVGTKRKLHFFTSHTQICQWARCRCKSQRGDMTADKR